MNRALGGCAVVLVLIAATVLGIGMLASKDWKVERSAVIQAPSESVFPLVADLGQWPVWSKWCTNADPNRTRTFTGPPGPGMRMAWTTDRGQDCVLTLLEAAPATGVVYRLDITDFRSTAGGAIAFAPAADGATLVTWTMEGEMRGVLGGFFAKLMDSQLGKLIQDDVIKLKIVVETQRATAGEG